MAEWWPRSHIFVVPDEAAKQWVCENVGNKSKLDGVFLLPRAKVSELTAAVFGKGGEPVLVVAAKGGDTLNSTSKVYFLNCSPTALSANMIVLRFGSTTLPLQELLHISHEKALEILEKTKPQSGATKGADESALCAFDLCDFHASGSNVCGACGKSYCSTMCMMQGCKDCPFLVF